MRKIQRCQECGARRGLKWATEVWPYCEDCADGAIQDAADEAAWQAAHPGADDEPFEVDDWDGAPPPMSEAELYRRCPPWTSASEEWARRGQ